MNLENLTVREECVTKHHVMITLTVNVQNREITEMERRLVLPRAREGSRDTAAWRKVTAKRCGVCFMK
jgi:hypothetical protein